MVKHPIRIISHKGPTALVEWTIKGDYFRAYVPIEVIVDGKVSEDELTAGAGYGVRWEEILSIRITPEAVARQLRRLGIWTSEDLRKAGDKLRMAIWEAVEFDKVALIERATEE